MPSHRFSYDPALDGVRGVAILAVMAFNAHVPGFGGGFVGVDAFFVLSGFLITILLVREWDLAGRIALARFYLRRALRLLPALFALVAACVAYAALVATPEGAAAVYRGALFALFYVANWEFASTTFAGLGPFNHTWSLSVEEQFYIVWPLLLGGLLGSGLGRRRTLRVVLALAAAAAVWRAALWMSGAHVMRLYCGSDTRADALLLGCAAALVYAGTPTTPAGALLRSGAAVGVAVFALFVVFGSYTSGFMYLGGLSLVAGASAVVVLAVARSEAGPIRRALESSPLVATGRISYGLYLWHYPIFALLDGTRLGLDDGGLAVQTLRFAAAFAVAGLSYGFVERPFLRLKDRLHRGRAGAGVEPAPAPVA